MSKPLVTVLMNCFNGERYLREALESVLAQTWQDWEVIFWDNQSTDSSAAIFQSYDDPRLRYIHAPTHTLLYEARGLALPHARGDLIAFLDVDDAWDPHKLERQVPLFDNPQVGITCTNYWIDSEINGQRWLALKSAPPSGMVLDELLGNYFVGLVTLMIRCSALSGVERTFGSDYNIIGDFDLVVRLAETWQLDYVDQPLAMYRLHGGNLSTQGRARHIAELENWQTEMQRSARFASRPGFKAVSEKIAYLHAMNGLLDGDRRKAMRYMRSMSPMQALRIAAGLLMPGAMVRKIKK